MPRSAGAEKGGRGDKSASVPEVTAVNAPEPTFEQTIGELQQIVNDLEDNSLGLEASLLQFERGIGLLRTCHVFLEQAEQKIEILVKYKANDEPVLAPFDSTPTAGISDPKSLF